MKLWFWVIFTRLCIWRWLCGIETTRYRVLCVIRWQYKAYNNINYMAMSSSDFLWFLERYYYCKGRHVGYVWHQMPILFVQNWLLFKSVERCILLHGMLWFLNVKLNLTLRYLIAYHTCLVSIPILLDIHTTSRNYEVNALIRGTKWK